MTSRDASKSTPANPPGNDFTKIAGIGATRERRLHDAGIITYQDITACTPEQLADVVGLSAELVTSQDWIGQARRLARPVAQPLPSEPSQHYVSFHVEFLLDVDNSVRRTKIHHHQSNIDDAWPGWDEHRLLALLRDHTRLTASRQPTESLDLQSFSVPPSDQMETAFPSSSRPPASTSPTNLHPSLLRIEELTPTQDGQRSCVYPSGVPTSVRLTLRIIRSGRPRAATADFAADITARNKGGDNRRWSLGTTQGTIRIEQPLSVELTGPTLPPGLYRLEAALAIYPADHMSGSQPLYSKRVTGELLHVTDAPSRCTPEAELVPSRS